MMDKNQLGMDRMLQDLWLRQRNIVFPDTVRNEGNFYRNLARRDQSHDALIRVGKMMVAVYFLFMGCFFLAGALGSVLLLRQGWHFLGIAVLMFGADIVSFAIGAKLAIAAMFSLERRNVDERIIRRRRLSGRR